MELCQARLPTFGQLCSIALATLFISFPTLTAASALPRGDVTIARPGPHALIIWNVTRQLGSYHHSNLPHYQILEQLEAHCLQIIANRSPHLKKATFVSVRVEYARQNSNPSIARLFTLTTPLKPALQHRRQWENAILHGTPPQAVLINDNGPL